MEIINTLTSKLCTQQSGYVLHFDSGKANICHSVRVQIFVCWPGSGYNF